MVKNHVPTDEDEDEDDILDKNPPTLIEQIAEAMAIYAGDYADAEHFLPQAKALLDAFIATEGREPRDYMEIENWSRGKLDKSGRLLVVK